MNMTGKHRFKVTLTRFLTTFFEENGFASDKMHYQALVSLCYRGRDTLATFQ